MGLHDRMNILILASPSPSLWETSLLLREICIRVQPTFCYTEDVTSEFTGVPWRHGLSDWHVPS